MKILPKPNQNPAVQNKNNPNRLLVGNGRRVKPNPALNFKLNQKVPAQPKPNTALGLIQSGQNLGPAIGKDGMNHLNPPKPNFQNLMSQLGGGAKPPQSPTAGTPLSIKGANATSDMMVKGSQTPSVPLKESVVQQPEPAQPEAPAPAQPAPTVPPAPAQPAPTPAPQVVSPAAQAQEQKNQMFPPPAAPAAPQVTPPAGVTKSQAEIDEEKKKQMSMNPV